MSAELRMSLKTEWIETSEVRGRVLVTLRNATIPASLEANML